MEPKATVHRRCQRCKRNRKGCDLERPCTNCKKSGLTAEQCESGAAAGVMRKAPAQQSVAQQHLEVPKPAVSSAQGERQGRDEKVQLGKRKSRNSPSPPRSRPSMASSLSATHKQPRFGKTNRVRQAHVPLPSRSGRVDMSSHLAHQHFNFGRVIGGSAVAPQGPRVDPRPIVRNADYIKPPPPHDCFQNQVGGRCSVCYTTDVNWSKVDTIKKICTHNSRWQYTLSRSSYGVYCRPGRPTPWFCQYCGDRLGRWWED